MKTKARKVRNVLLLALALVLVLGSCLALFGCGGDDSGSTKGADYVVTFDYNYDGGSSKKVGVYDGVLDTPSVPEREGYVFTGWYTDASATTAVDFDTITGATTVYAGWNERKEGKVYVYLYYNITGSDLYTTVEVDSGARMSEVVTVYSPSMTGYKFKGWYSDQSCTTAVSQGDYITSDISLYASMYKGWTFEAEDVNLYNSNNEMRSFHGYSDNGTPVRSDSAASGGYFIGDMYVEECYIDFEIMCSEAVADANLSLRAAMDYGWAGTRVADGNDITITSDDYKVIVNGTAVSYTAMIFSGAAALSKAGDRTAFATYDLCTVSLNAGSNTVRLQVDNSVKGEGGTMTSIAPLVDYMMLYAPIGATMSMTKY